MKDGFYLFVYFRITFDILHALLPSMGAMQPWSHVPKRCRAWLRSALRLTSDFLHCVKLFRLEMGAGLERGLHLQYVQPARPGKLYQPCNAFCSESTDLPCVGLQGKSCWDSSSFSLRTFASGFCSGVDDL